MRRIRWLGIVGGLVLLLGVLSAGGCAYFKEWRHLPTSKSDEVTIYIVSHGWHTGIVVPRNHLGEHLAFIPQQMGEYSYYEFGWGEKDFYQAPDNTIPLALQAVLWIDDSTMHVAALPRAPDQYFPASETVTLHVSPTACRTSPPPSRFVCNRSPGQGRLHGQRTVRRKQRLLRWNGPLSLL